jgi:hypothetical protein
MCPPHNPLTPGITQKIVSEYSDGILFQVEVRVEDFVGEEWRTRHIPTELIHKKILAKLEGRSFCSGFPRALRLSTAIFIGLSQRWKCSVPSGWKQIEVLKYS